MQKSDSPSEMPDYAYVSCYYDKIFLLILLLNGSFGRISLYALDSVYAAVHSLVVLEGCDNLAVFSFMSESEFSVDISFSVFEY